MTAPEWIKAASLAIELLPYIEKLVEKGIDAAKELEGDASPTADELKNRLSSCQLLYRELPPLPEAASLIPSPPAGEGGVGAAPDSLEPGA